MKNRPVLMLFVCLATTAFCILDIYELRDIKSTIKDFIYVIENSEPSSETPTAFASLSIKLDDIVQNIEQIETHLRRIDIQQVTVTAYTPRVSECDIDPTRTASMARPRIGTVAVSRDLFEAGWTFGKKVYLKNIGVYEINDLMNPRFKNRIDVFIDDLEQAKKFGKKKTVAAIINYS